MAETFLSSVSSDYTFDQRVLNQDAYDLFRQNVFQQFIADSIKRTVDVQLKVRISSDGDVQVR